ncbi:MAG: S-layer homology domain-containing protein [Oscillospiraceae bacterium]|nr:S-layer homology domain-containing protein [Oscillospiraceae bacterium]
MSYRGIVSLSGIEYFTALKWLFCYENQLTTLDVSQNTALEILSCTSNQLTMLDLSNNTNLEMLDCRDNYLASKAALGFTGSWDALDLWGFPANIFDPQKTGAPPSGAPSGWAAEAVSRAKDLGVLPESLQSSYQQNTTRAEFCELTVALIEKLTGKEITERESFTDTSDINVQKIAGLGIVTGRGGGVFDPNSGISRQEAAVILEKVARKGLGKELPEGVAAFNDIAGSYAEKAIRQMRGVSPGIMSGKSADTFDPDGKFTREESVSTMLKLWEWFNK